jgi:PPOX class probable F420-dependent enzyme
VTPIWFTMDGDDVVLTTHEDGVKGKALRRDPRAALCVDDQQPPYSFVVIEGHVTVSGDVAEVRKWATALGGRYMGAGQAEAFGARNGVPGEARPAAGREGHRDARRRRLSAPADRYELREKAWQCLSATCFARRLPP